MRSATSLPVLVLAVQALAACGTDDPPTAPAEAGPVFSHTAGHRLVNSTADPGNGTCDAAQCTLREAIADPGSTEITFASGLAGPVTLARSLVIEKSLAITGPSAGIVIQRRSTGPEFRILRSGSGASVRLRNLTLRNGRTDLPGGGIINFGTLTLTRCTVSGNRSAQHGGGIDNHGPLTLTNTKVVDNTAATLGRGITATISRSPPPTVPWPATPPASVGAFSTAAVRSDSPRAGSRTTPAAASSRTGVRPSSTACGSWATRATTTAASCSPTPRCGRQ